MVTRYPGGTLPAYQVGTNRSGHAINSWRSKASLLNGSMDTYTPIGRRQVVREISPLKRDCEAMLVARPAAGNNKTIGERAVIPCSSLARGPPGGSGLHQVFDLERGPHN